MKKRIAVGLILVASLTACGGGASDGWSKEQKDERIAGCTEFATSRGADPSKARTYCECSVDAIAKKYTFEEAQTLDKEAATSAEKAVELAEIVDECSMRLD